MKKLSALFVIFVLLASGIANAAHACCADEDSSHSSHIDQVVDVEDNQQADIDSLCDCSGCGCAHHGHSKIPFAHNNIENLLTTAAVQHLWDGDIYHSQLHDPISKPPKS